MKPKRVPTVAQVFLPRSAPLLCRRMDSDHRHSEVEQDGEWWGKGVSSETLIGCKSAIVYPLTRERLHNLSALHNVISVQLDSSSGDPVSPDNSAASSRRTQFDDSGTPIKPGSKKLECLSV